MSLHPHVIEPVPDETARVAHAAFPKGHPYLTFRDALGTIFQDEDFTTLFPAWGQPGLPPWRLALVTIMQRSEEHTSELQSRLHLVCRLLLEKKKKTTSSDTRDLQHMPQQ